MTRPFLCLLGLVLSLAGTARLSAHDPVGFDGIVVKMDTARGVLTIQTIENGQPVNVDLTFDANTTITEDGQAVPRSALTAGVHVLVSGLGCIDEPKIDVVAVKIVPPGEAGSAMAMPAAEAGMEIPQGDRIPTVALRMTGRSKGAWSFKVTTNLALTETSGAYEPMRGHLHVYVDGTPILMISKTQFVVNDLAPGTHTVRVVLSGTNHQTLLHNGQAIAASVNIDVPIAKLPATGGVR